MAKVRTVGDALVATRSQVAAATFSGAYDRNLANDALPQFEAQLRSLGVDTTTGSVKAPSATSPADAVKALRAQLLEANHRALSDKVQALACADAFVGVLRCAGLAVS